MSDAWKTICKRESETDFDARHCIAAGSESKAQSPIDRYLRTTRSLTIGAGYVLAHDAPEYVQATQVDFGKLLVLGLVSEVERYFRRLLSGLILFCPHCCEIAGNEEVKLNALLTYGSDNIGPGLFAEVSFASKGGIIAQSARIAGMKIKRGTSLDACLDSFDQLCHIRHASVHSGGELGIRNLTALGVDPKLSNEVRIDTFAKYSTCAKVSSNAVRAYNFHCYTHIVQTWINKKILKGAWDGDRYLYSKLHSLFYSVEDQVGSQRAYNAYQSLRRSIVAAQ